MPWRWMAKKDVVWLRKAVGSCQTNIDPQISEWGNLTEIVIRKEANAGN